jgi:hypothetical protein
LRDQTRFWAYKIALFPAATALHDKSLRFRVELHGTLAVQSIRRNDRRSAPCALKAVHPTSLSRQACKKLWDYIKKNELQDEKNKTLINADGALKVVFGGKKQVSMFEMTKLVSGHVK